MSKIGVTKKQAQTVIRMALEASYYVKNGEFYPIEAVDEEEGVMRCVEDTGEEYTFYLWSAECSDEDGSDVVDLDAGDKFYHLAEMDRRNYE